MIEIVTNDGSVTFRSDKFDETYHSKSGAVEESFKKFAEPSKVGELAKSGKIVILDICFGLGYNSAAAIDAIFRFYCGRFCPAPVIRPGQSATG